MLQLLMKAAMRYGIVAGIELSKVSDCEALTIDKPPKPLLTHLGSKRALVEWLFANVLSKRAQTG